MLKWGPGLWRPVDGVPMKTRQEAEQPGVVSTGLINYLLVASVVLSEEKDMGGLSSELANVMSLLGHPVSFACVICAAEHKSSHLQIMQNGTPCGWWRV